MKLRAGYKLYSSNGLILVLVFCYEYSNKGKEGYMLYVFLGGASA